jgi:hypothetical protein
MRGWWLVVALGIAMPVPAAEPPAAWSVQVAPSGELYPALDLSQRPRSAPAGEGSGLVSVRVGPLAETGTLSLRIDTEGLRAPSRIDFAAPAPGRTVEIRPRLDWDLAALRTLAVPRAQVLRADLRFPDGRTRTLRLEVRVHPLDEALYFVREGADRVDLGWVFAGFVDPGDAVVDRILADARTLGFGDALDATADDAPTRLRRAWAIWGALQARGLRYAAGSPAITQGPRLWSQRVRLPATIWRERRANCVDGSLLIAAALERLGIPAFLVLLPGHALVGFYSDGDRRHAEFLETTALGARPAALRRFPDYADSEPPAALASLPAFETSRAAGRARWQRERDRFDAAHRPDYALIDIATARRLGIVPFSSGATGRADETAAAGAVPPDPAKARPAGGR